MSKDSKQKVFSERIKTEIRKTKNTLFSLSGSSMKERGERRDVSETG